ncbi:MAG: pseudouridine synthase [Cyanobacteriota bacterium]
MPKLREYRINQFIAQATGCSRRDAEKYIADGLVKVDGKNVSELSLKVTSRNKITLKNQPLKLSNYSYYIMNKPAGFITTREDEKARKTIYDILPEKLHNLKPVGRLDKDSSGLLVLTNDGELIHNLTHPKFHIPKKYKANIRGKFSQSDSDKFRKGIDIGEKLPACAEVESIIKTKLGYTEVVLILHQGYNRQIRRMFESVDCEVINLKRYSIGTLTLKGLKRAEFSQVKSNELNNLQKYINKKIKEADLES